MLGKDAQVLLNQLSTLMDEKLEEPFSHVRGFINGKITTEQQNMKHRYWCINQGSIRNREAKSDNRDYETVATFYML